MDVPWQHINTYILGGRVHGNIDAAGGGWEEITRAQSCRLCVQSRCATQSFVSVEF